jgi:hypothetical protein
VISHPILSITHVTESGVRGSVKIRSYGKL